MPITLLKHKDHKYSELKPEDNHEILKKRGQNQPEVESCYRKQNKSFQNGWTKSTFSHFTQLALTFKRKTSQT
jgi:hypothetical protein